MYIFFVCVLLQNFPRMYEKSYNYEIKKSVNIVSYDKC